jgi:xylose dehydrogenase (NAD/NADP)
MNSTVLRIGVLGAANIARLFVAGVAPSEKVKVTTIGSRDSEKAAAFAKEVGVDRSHGSYEALLADPEIDAVYIPLPNGMHAAWAIRAVEAGKHVLCEKPIAVTGAEAEAMFAAARASGRHLVEAYPYLAQPQTLKLREILGSGSLGRIRLIRASFAFTLADRSNVRFNPALGGGALLDAGSYPISLVRVLAGERPVRAHGVAQWDGDIDLTTLATLEFANGILAQVSCSFAAAFHRQAIIACEEGVIETTYLNHPPVGGLPVVHVRRGRASPTPASPSKLEIVEVPGGNGFLAEADSFASLVAGDPDAWTGATAEESVDIMLTLEAIRKSARSGAWVEIG